MGSVDLSLKGLLLVILSFGSVSLGFSTVCLGFCLMCLSFDLMDLSLVGIGWVGLG